MGKQVKRKSRKIGVFKNTSSAEGARKIYNSIILNKDVTLEPIIPLDSDTCL